MDFQRFSAKTVGDAVTAACQHFLVTSDKLEYEILEEGSTGFLGFNAKPAVIQARVRVTVEDKALQFLNDVFAAMKMDVVMDIAYDEVEKHLDIDLKGDEMGILIGKRGQTLDSLQYLVSLVVNKDSEDYIRVKVDTEDYRKRRKETLENLAKNIAYKVKRSRRPVALEPMNPYERRIIHAALQNDKFVTTRSEGEEPFRHVVIALKREASFERKGRYDRNRAGRYDRTGGYSRNRAENGDSFSKPAADAAQETAAGDNE